MRAVLYQTFLHLRISGCIFLAFCHTIRQRLAKLRFGGRFFHTYPAANERPLHHLSRKFLKVKISPNVVLHLKKRPKG